MSVKPYSLLACLTFSLLSWSAQADWQLDNGQSSLSFVSIKNGSILETHTFKTLSGRVDASGLATLTVNLDSVDTLIPIRNERMQKMLFNTAKFPEAVATIQLDPSIVQDLANSESVQQVEIAGNLSIKGVSKRISARVAVSGAADGGVLLTTTHPIMIAANDWQLGPGIEALREVAGLSSITPVVPVTLILKFIPAQAGRSTGSNSGSASVGQSTNIE